jgi:hypothetical protein
VSFENDNGAEIFKLMGDEKHILDESMASTAEEIYSEKWQPGCRWPIGVEKK